MVSEPVFPLLAVDSGNTRIKWGVHDGRSWKATGAIATAEAAKLAAAWKALGPVRRAIASNVAGKAVQAALERAGAAAGAVLTVIASEREQLGVRNGYRDPRQLGADRWAALIAANRLQATHQLVVNVGTALTIDALTADGCFLGGLIVPGPALMRRSLEGGTAQLRLTEGEFQDFPDSTRNAISSGAVQACVGAVERMHDRMSAQGFAPQRLVVSGGGAAPIADHLPAPLIIDENLVLEGLALIARHC